jgi:hypothetical protein
MKTQWTSSLGEFDKIAFLAQVQIHLRSVLIKGMRAFLLAAVPRIPVRTGFARSAFRNLEDIAGKVNVDSQSGGFRIRGTRGGGRDLRRSNEYYTGSGGRVLKTTQSGRDFATPSNQIMNLTGASLATGRTAFYFKFEVNITYVDLLDRSVWGAFKAGTDAMEAYLRNNINKEFPQVGKFLLRKIT